MISHSLLSKYKSFLVLLFYPHLHWKQSKFSVKIFKPQCPKMHLRTWDPSKDTDQPAHSCSLIRLFTVHILDSQGCKVSACWERWLDGCTDWFEYWAHLSEHYENMPMVNVLIFRTPNCLTKWHMRTVQTQIRLLLKEQSDQGLHCLPFH